MSAILNPPHPTRVSFSGGIPSGVFISTLQQQFTDPVNDWPSKLKFWQFGLQLAQKLEQERFFHPESEFNRSYEGILILLLALGTGLKEEIDDPTIVEHVKANIDNLNSKYITFKMPPLENSNRLLEKLVA